MARTGRFFVLKVNPRNFLGEIQATKNIYDTEMRDAIDKVANFTVKTMKSLVPVRTGRLRESIRVQKKTNSKNITNLKHTVEVGSPLNYFRFLDRGTNQSPGRFVPFLGKKLITLRPGFGFHPGIKAMNITEKTKNMVENSTGVTLEKMLRSWKRSAWDRIK